MNTNIKINSLTKELIFFIVLYILSFAINFLNINLPHFDWLNYKFYDVWAFLNNRTSIDFAPAGFRTYFSNLSEIINYFFITKFNSHPILFIAINSINIPILIYIVYKISTYLFKDNLFFVYFAVLVALFQPLLFFERGFGYNDITVAIPILLSFYLLIKNLFIGNSKTRNLYLFLSGAIIGTAFVLKPTTIVYCFTVILSFLVLFKKLDKPLFVFLYFMLGFISSFILIDGVFRYTVYKQFSNPFFPYFQNIFFSQYAKDANIIGFDYSILRPKEIFEVIFYPFLKSNANTQFGDQWGVVDIRIPIAYVFSVVSLLLFVFKNIMKDKYNANYLINDNLFIFLLFFIILSYLINMLTFGVYRYIIASCSLFGILYIIVLYQIFSVLNLNEKYKKRIIYIFLSFLFLIIIIFTGILNAEISFSIPKISKIIEIKDYSIQDNSTVFVSVSGSSYIIPFLNKNAKYHLWNVATFEKNVFNDKFTNVNIEILKNPFKKKYIIFRTADYKDFNIDLPKEITQYAGSQSNQFNIINCHDFDTKFFSENLEHIRMICEIKNK